SGTSFSGETSFQNAVFSAKGHFFKATFNDEVKFTAARFEKVANFDQANFNGSADFIRTEFHGWTYFSKNTKRMPWRGRFRYTAFGGDVTMQEVDLSQCSFLHSDIDKVDFRHCRFAREREYFLGFLPISRENVLCDEVEAKTNIEFDMASRAYRDLVKNFDDKGDRHMAIDFFYGEMECRRKQVEPWGRSFSVHALSRQITGYGVKFARSGFFIGLLILVSCLFYRFCGHLHWGEAFNQSLFGINVLLAHVYHYSEKLSSPGIAYFCFEIVLGSFLTTSFVLILQRVFTPFK
ncbi:MAG: pentapeptide repeat-containing protein, partial [Candidatus Thorarchaeota archaeon]